MTEYDLLCLRISKVEQHLEKMQKWGCTSWAVNYWQGVLMSLYNSIPEEKLN